MVKWLIYCDHPDGPFQHSKYCYKGYFTVFNLYKFDSNYNVTKQNDTLPANNYKNASMSQLFFTCSFLEKVKNSSPEKVSANCMPTDSQQAVGWRTEF